MDHRMTALRVAGTAALLLSALLGSVPAKGQAYVPGVTCPSGKAMTGYTPQTGIVCGAPVVRSYLAGLTLSNDGTSPNTVLDIAAGQAADSTNAAMIALGAFTKSTGGAWASGSGANGMGNGLTIADNTWYHVCLANNAGTPDIWFDTSPTCANEPAGITDTKYRRIGSFLTNGSANIKAFSQNGDEFLWATPTFDMNAVATATSAAAVTLTVPTGFTVWAEIIANLNYNSANAETTFYSPNGAANNADAATFIVTSGAPWSTGEPAPIRTNSSGQIEVVSSSAGAKLYELTLGWIDRRGRDN
jgi:hypothetical protein